MFERCGRMITALNLFQNICHIISLPHTTRSVAYHSGKGHIFPSELLGFWTLFIVRNSKPFRTLHFLQISFPLLVISLRISFEVTCIHTYLLIRDVEMHVKSARNHKMKSSAGSCNISYPKLRFSCSKISDAMAKYRTKFQEAFFPWRWLPATERILPIRLLLLLSATRACELNRKKCRYDFSIRKEEIIWKYLYVQRKFTFEMNLLCTV
jgi:hypothetical protein